MSAVSTTWRSRSKSSSGVVEVRTRLPKGGLFSGKGKVNYQITLPATPIDLDGAVHRLGVQTAPDAGEARASPASGAVWTFKTVNGSVEVEARSR